MDVLEIGWGINFEPAWATVALGFGKFFFCLLGVLPLFCIKNLIFANYQRLVV